MPKVRPNFAQVKAAAFMAALLPCPALADDLVVTANRVETEAEKLGSSVTVITAADIERQQARTVAEVLRTVPGLSLSNTGGTGRDTAIRIRGAEAYHTKLMVDGVDLSDPSRTQPSYDFGHLLATDIERIEVVRGPQSLLYGGDAVGGVINIITKQAQGAPKVSAMAEAGSLHTYTGAASVSGSQDRLSYAINASRFETDGISAADSRNGNSERDPYWNNSLTAKLGLRLTETWNVEASGRYMRSHVDYDDWTTQAVDDTDSMRQTERSGRIATNVSLFNGRLKNMLAYSVAETERDIDNGNLYWGDRFTSFDGESQKLEYQGTAKLATNHTLVFGAETKEESTTQSDLAADVANNGYYADYQFSPLHSLYLTVGGRIDDHQSYGTHTTGRTTAAYLVDATATRLHGSYGTGFRAPSLYELYHPTYGNRDLSPEESRGWDTGVEQTFLNGKAMLDVTWFDNRIQDLIQWQSAGYTNIASTRAQGLEATGHWTLTEQWRLTGGYTYTESRNNMTGQILARRPKHQGSLGLAWTPLDQLHTEATLRMVGDQYDSATGRTLGGFATADLRVGYDLTEAVELFGRVENLADKSYQEVDSYGSLGRMGFVGVKATF